MLLLWSIGTPRVRSVLIAPTLQKRKVGLESGPNDPQGHLGSGDVGMQHIGTADGEELR